MCLSENLEGKFFYQEAREKDTGRQLAIRGISSEDTHLTHITSSDDSDPNTYLPL